mmetsp:Transcript_18991/g.21156  ORF Transcript_18991/g.21156 Transcript_18991/m.21156 type:complete len:219 (+) Transcript_18991:350-1006(+)
MSNLCCAAGSLLFELGGGTDLVGLGLKFSLFDSGLTFNLRCGGTGASLGCGLTRGFNDGTLGLELEQRCTSFFGLSFIGNLLTFEATTGFLFTALCFVSGSGFLGLGCDLDGQLDGFLKSVTGSLIDRLDGLDINVGDKQVVGAEGESVLDTRSVLAEYGFADDQGGVLVEVVEGNGSDTSTDAGSDGFAGITNEIWYGEDLGRVCRILTIYLKVPVV